jgi:hypothetical protein
VHARHDLETHYHCDDAMTLPNILVIGAHRAGTTLLDRLLEAHPEIYVPYRHKEIVYLDCSLPAAQRLGVPDPTLARCLRRTRAASPADQGLHPRAPTARPSASSSPPARMGLCASLGDLPGTHRCAGPLARPFQHRPASRRPGHQPPLSPAPIGVPRFDQRPAFLHPDLPSPTTGPPGGARSAGGDRRQPARSVLAVHPQNRSTPSGEGAHA